MTFVAVRGAQMRKVPSTSKELLSVAVASRSGIVVADDTVQFAFTADKQDPTTWSAGEWEGPNPSIEDVGNGYQRAWVAHYLITPGSLTEGKWFVWVKVNKGTQEIVREAGKIEVI